MKRFEIYRKLILIAGTVIAAVSVGSVFFMENTSALMLFVICAFAILCGLLFCSTSCTTAITMIC